MKTMGFGVKRSVCADFCGVTVTSHCKGVFPGRFQASHCSPPAATGLARLRR